MYKNKKILALIPARGGSKGLPGKNIKLLLGKPLIARTIGQVKKSKYVDKIVVSTDDLKIADISRKYGAEVPFLRPAALAADTASSASVILHAIDFLEKKNIFFDYICLLEPTSPLRETKDIDIPIEMLVNTHRAEAVVSISSLESRHPEFNITLTKNKYIRKYGTNEVIRTLRRQELKTAYFPEGTIYISTVSAFKRKKTFYHNKTLGYVVPRYKELEIDDAFDLVMAEAILKYLLKTN